MKPASEHAAGFCNRFVINCKGNEVVEFVKAVQKDAISNMRDILREAENVIQSQLHQIEIDTHLLYEGETHMDVLAEKQGNEFLAKLAAFRKETT